MRKLFIPLVVLILLATINLFFASKSAFAATCTLETDPPEVTTETRTINLTIKTGDLIEGDKNKTINYWVKIGGVYGFIGLNAKSLGQNYAYTNGAINVYNVNAKGVVNPSDANQTKFLEQSYPISVWDEEGKSEICQTKPPLVVKKAVSGGYCTIDFQNTSFTTNDDLIIKVDNLKGQDSDSRRVILRRKDINGPTLESSCKTIGQLKNQGVSLNRREKDDYYIELRDACSLNGWGEGRTCFKEFRVDVPGSNTGGVISSGGQSTPLPTPVCAPGGLNAKNECEKVDTGLGIPINTNPAEFIKSLFSIILGLAGGIALILIIISGYKLMVSQGNPEKVKEAQESLTSAIVGLLFIIFSLVILQIIGVDLLKIPGFS